MKTKNMCFAAALILITGCCQAQTMLGLRAGVSLSEALVKENGSREQTKQQPGGLLGVYANFPVASVFYVQPSLQYEMKGVKSKATDATTRLGYLTLPVDLLYKPSPGAGWFAGAGPYLGYGVTGKLSGGATDGKIDPFKGSDGLRRFDAGAHLQAGYEFPGGFSMGVQSELGLVNLEKNGQANQRFRNLSFTATIGYTFGQ